MWALTKVLHNLFWIGKTAYEGYNSSVSGCFVLKSWKSDPFGIIIYESTR